MGSATRRRLNEKDMVDEKVPAPKRRLGAHSVVQARFKADTARIIPNLPRLTEPA